MIAEELISVIVPIYKVEHYLPKCIDSILAQTYTNIEVILVDDGSPDQSGRIADDYAEKDKRIRVIHKPNGGLSSARNAGINIARGAYIGFVDSDDYIHFDMYSKLYIAVKTSQADMAICNYIWVKEDGTLSEADSYRDKIDTCILDRSAAFAKLFDRSNVTYVTAVNKLYKSSLLNVVRFPEGKIHEDEFTIHHFFAQCNRIACISDVLYYYVKREGSITSNFSLHNFDGFDARLDRYDFFKKNGYEQFAETLLRSSIHSLLLKGKEIHNTKMLVRWSALVTKHGFLIFHSPKTWVRILKKLPGKVVRYTIRYKKWVSVKYRFARTAVKGKRVVLTATPEHSNTGDHAIVYAEQKLLERCGLVRNTVEIPNSVYMKYGEHIQKLVRPQDLILIDGGGNMGTLWVDEDDKIADIIYRFHKNKIIVFPQTCYYGDDSEQRQKYNKDIYASAPELLLTFRDKVSFDFARATFPESRCVYMPDIVLSLNDISKKKRRGGVLLCFRKDHEKVMDEEALDRIKDYLENRGMPYAMTDTVIGKEVSAGNRDTVLRSKWLEFGSAGLVITDRLHGMIFAAITCTPCIALDNVSKKVSGVYDWIKGLPYVRILDDPAKITGNIQTMYSIREAEYRFDYPYFFEEEIRRWQG